MSNTFLRAANPSSVKGKIVNGSGLEGPGRAKIFTRNLENILTTSPGAQASGNMAIVTSQSAQNRQILSFRRPILAPQRLKVATAPGWQGQGELTYLLASSKALKLRPMGLRLVLTWQY